LKKFKVHFLFSQTMACVVDAECKEDAIQIADAQADRTGVKLQTFVRQFDVGTPKAGDPRLLEPEQGNTGYFQHLLITELD
jgi:hypothetical protein